MTPAPARSSTERRDRPRPRLLMFSHTALMSGAPYSFLLLVEALRADYAVTVLMPETGPLAQRLRALDVPVFTLPMRPWRVWYGYADPRKWIQVWRLRQLIRRHDADLVYMNEGMEVLPAFVLACRLTRRRLMVHLRLVITLPLAYRRASRFWYRRVDQFVACSRAVERSYRQLFALRRIATVENGVVLERFAARSAAARRELCRRLGLADDDGTRLLITLSSVKQRKGLDLALAALRRVADRRPAVHWLVLGDQREPDTARALREQARALGLDDRLHLLGERDTVASYLAGADLMLHPSRREGLSRAVIEGSAAALPVVAFDIPGMDEIVTPQTGALVPPFDVDALAAALLGLLDDRQRRADLGGRGRRRVRERFSAVETARRVARLIDATLRR